jgi:hypothetical protein
MHRIFRLGAAPLVTGLLLLVGPSAAWADCTPATSTPAGPVVASGSSGAVTGSETTGNPTIPAVTTPATSTSATSTPATSGSEPTAPVLESSASGPSGPLAFTGLDLSREAGVGSGLGLVGLVLAVSVRRRRTPSGGRRRRSRAAVVGCVVLATGALVLLVGATAGWAAPAGTAGKPSAVVPAVSAAVASPPAVTTADCTGDTTPTTSSTGLLVQPAAALPETPVAAALPVAALVTFGVLTARRRRAAR